MRRYGYLGSRREGLHGRTQPSIQVPICYFCHNFISSCVLLFESMRPCFCEGLCVGLFLFSSSFSIGVNVVIIVAGVFCCFRYCFIFFVVLAVAVAAAVNAVMPSIAKEASVVDFGLMLLYDFH